MQVPLEIVYRGVDKTNALESLIREKVSKLERVCDHIISCHVAVEQTHEHPSAGSPYRVRINLTVPPGHELAVDKSPDQGTQYKPPEALIRDAFEAAQRQLTELVDRQQQKVKQHPDQSAGGIITQLFASEGYGFLKTFSGQEVYFHKNSVLHDDFDRLTVGTGVRFLISEGESGPQASTLQVVDKPGERAGKGDQAEDTAATPPLGWQ
ncbi:HPF/RaiA family ribosome-associated protein [Almyronema epifaneia]|uniref:HPF/RaiA family ribosome-associated protein n=1 Tax=Almyronema epifaneia S1 TaxID=2991925 RepID=A0ABW6IBY3_9CYAN